MANNPKYITILNKVTDAQLETLVEGGTVTKGDDTLTADEGAVYLTPDTSVSYEEQSLTTEQQAQARTNIGAGTGTVETISVGGGSAISPDSSGNINVPVAGNSVKGVVDVRAFFGNEVDAYGRLATVKASNQEIDDKTNNYKAIVPSNYTYAVSKTYLKGSGVPTTSTVAEFEGQLYLDTTNNNTYQCVSITTESNVTTYTWNLVLKDTNISNLYGVGLDSGKLCTVGASDAEIDARVHVYHSITPAHLNYAVKAALSDANHLTMTAEEQATAQQVLGVASGNIPFIELTGTAETFTYTDESTQETETLKLIVFDIGDTDWNSLTENAYAQLLLDYTRDVNNNENIYTDIDLMLIVHNYASTMTLEELMQASIQITYNGNDGQPLMEPTSFRQFLSTDLGETAEDYTWCISGTMKVISEGGTTAKFMYATSQNLNVNSLSAGTGIAITNNVVSMTGGLPYLTTAPTEANTDGLKLVVLSSEPATRYSGYIYIITSSNS